MANIVMMSGYICSLKSHISKALAEQLGITRLETKNLGSISSEEEKVHRYEKLAALVENEISKGKNVILDGTFGKREYRTPVYCAALRSGVEDIIVIACSCYDKEEVLRRIEKRGTESQINNVCIREWITQSHDDVTKDIIRSNILGDKVPSLVAVDTAEYKVSPLHLFSDFSKNVNEKLEKIVNELRKDFVKGDKQSTKRFAEFLGDPFLFWDEPIPVKVAMREFVNARKKYNLPEDASFTCLSVDEIKGKGSTHYYGRYHFENGDINFFDYGYTWGGGGGWRKRVLSKWANLESMDRGPIHAVSIKFTPDPNW